MIRWSPHLYLHLSHKQRSSGYHIINIASFHIINNLDATPNFSRDPKVGQRTKQWNKKRVGARSLSQHFRGRRVCQSSRMGLGQIHKQRFKMKSTYIIKKRRWLMQVEWKWCGRFSRDNFKHKLYMADNLWEEARLPSL